MFVAITISVVTSCDEDDNKYPQLGEDPRTVTEIVSSNPELSSLLQSLQSVGLDTTLDETTTYTLFAPTNSAFTSTDLSGLSDEELEQVLLNHIINTGTADFSANIGTGYLTTMASGPDDTNLSLYVNRESGFEVNGVANTVSGMIDMGGSNGVVHAIDGILMPPTVVGHANGNPSFSMFAEALSLTGLDVTLSGSETFTLFVPTNDAFQAFMLSVQNDLGYTSLSEVPVDLLTEILLYHVISDQNILASDALGPHVSLQGEEFEVVSPGDQDGDEVLAKVNDQSEVDANVILADVQATNGIIHGVNKVLLSDSVIQVVKTATLNIVERARDAGYTLFADAVETAGLLDELTANSDPLTVFVPSNEALEILLLTGGFADLSEVDTDPEINALSSLLLYHVIDGFITSNDLVDGEISTLQGETIEVITGDPIQIQDKFDTPANIVTADISATNGIIHVVNDILASSQAVDDFGLNIIPPPAFGFEIYTDAPLVNTLSVVSAGWGGPDYDVESRGNVKTGSTSIRQTFAGGWSGFQMNVANNAAGAIDITGNEVLKASFYLPEGSTGATAIRVILNDNFATYPVVNLLEGEWVDVELPLSEFGNPTEFWQFAVQIEGDPITLYMDDIGIDPAPAQIEVYSEAPLQSGWEIVSSGWAGPDFDVESTDFVRTGFTSIRQTYAGGWSGFQLNVPGAAGGAIDISGVTTFKASFYLPVGSTGATAIRVVINDNYGAFPVVNLVEGEWVDVEYPLSAFGDPTEFWQFAIQIEGDPITLYMDNIGFH